MSLFNKRKKNIVDKNGVATSRWINDEPSIASTTRNIPQPVLGESPASSISNKHNEENRLLRLDKYEVFRDTVQPKPITEDARNLWLAVYLHQMGKVEKSDYSLLSRLETPTKDANIRYPEGYGSASFHGLILSDVTPKIDTEPYTDRQDWEYGHGKLYKLSIRNGYLVAETNETKVQATRSELRAARAIKGSSLLEFARTFYRELGIDKDIDEIYNAHDIAKKQEQARANSIQDQAPIDSINENSRRATETNRAESSRNKSSDSDHMSNSLDRAIQDPLGITDPGGVRDPLAAILRNSLFGDNGLG